MDEKIEELMKNMCESYPCNRICDQYCGMYDYAEKAIKKGYRKESDTAREILDELLDIEVKDEDYKMFFLDVCEKLEKFAKKYGVDLGE